MNKKELVIKALTAPPWRGQTLKTAVFASVMLLASSTLFAQVKIGANPTTIDANNNLEVESSTVGNKVFIKKTGKVTIADGTQGVDRVLTSDGTGEATWRAPSSQDADVMLTVTAGAQTVNTGGQTLNYNATSFDKNNNFDLATDLFTAPSSGYYHINLSAECNTLNPSASGRYAYVFINNVNYRLLFNQAVDANAGYTATAGALLKLQAGDQVKIVIGRAGTPSWVLSRAALDVYKISN